MNNKIKILISAYFFILLFFVFTDVALAAEAKLQVNIPSLPSMTGLPNLSQYISAIYDYAIGFVGILAAVVLMFSGIMWLTAGGNQGQVGEAKEWIKASLTGLVLALTSYMILNIINPDLTTLTMPDIPKAENTTPPSGQSYDSYNDTKTRTATLDNETVLHTNTGKPLDTDTTKRSLKITGNNHIDKIKTVITNPDIIEKGGLIEFQFASNLAKFIDHAKSEGYNIRVTSLNDGVHAEEGTHPIGRGADIGGLSAEESRKMGEWWINQGNNGKRYIDGYKDNHLHIDIGKPPK